MANRVRYRCGAVELRKVRVDANTLIFAGDMVWLKNGRAVPYKEGFTQEDFLGIAHQPSHDGDTDPISVDCSPMSIYEFDVDASTGYEVGDTLMPINSQLLKFQSHGGIARAVEYRKEGVSKLRVQFASAFHTASANKYAKV